MKKLFTLTVICILSAIVLSSCGSGMSITKRRYTKGYHVSKNQKPTETKEHQVAKHSKNETTLPEVIKVMPEKVSEESKQVSNQNNNNTTASAASKKGQKTETAQKEKSPLAKSFADFSVKKPVKSIDQAIKNHKLTAGSDRDGLSLFWIVILVLLILWALGFISGNFGGIINLLLIIALILLILWLLRIL